MTAEEPIEEEPPRDGGEGGDAGLDQTVSSAQGLDQTMSSFQGLDQTFQSGKGLDQTMAISRAFGETLRSDMSGATIGGYRDDRDEDEDDRVLVVKFEVVSRWRGTGGGAKCPPIQPMTGPSSVTSLVSLVSSVVAGYESGNIFVWDATGCSAAPLHQFQASKVAISGLAYLPRIDAVVSTATPGKKDKAVSEASLKVWSCSNFELRQIFALHGSATRDLCSIIPEEKNGTICLALAKETRTATLLQLLKLDTPV